MPGLPSVPAVWAQAAPDILLEQQRQADEERRRREQILQPRDPAQIKKPAQPRPPKGGGKTVLVTRIEISGNTVIPTPELDALVASAIGQALTIGQLKEVAERIAQHYIGKGYILGRAYLPPQEIRDGVVRMAVVEGRVGDITVEGNRRYAAATILRALAPVRRRGVLHEGTLETAIAGLNDYPGLKVRADLKAGAQPGLSDLTLRVSERLPHTLSLDVTNYGSALTGPWLYGTTVGLGNLVGQGDTLTFRGNKSDDALFLTHVAYLVPLSSFGTTLQLAWSHSENVVGNQAAIDAARPVGRSDIVSADLLHTVTRTSGSSFLVNVGVDGKTIRNIFTVGNPANLQSKDEIRIVRLGLRGDARDAWLGRTYFGLTWHYGIEGLGGSNRNARQTSFARAGPGNWHKWTSDLSRVQPLNLPVLQGLPVLPTLLNDSYLFLRVTGQVSDDRLLSPERFSIGGYYTVRGYPVAESVGDHGYAATAELVLPVPSARTVPFSSRPWKEVVQVAAFVDHGGTFVSPVTAAPTLIPQVFLTGAGVGLRVTLPFGLPNPVDAGQLALKIDWATAIGRPRPTSRDQGISLNNVYGEGAAGMLYVSAALRF